MIIIALLLLLVPGLISLRILWRGKKINLPDLKFVISDYLIYSFLNMLAAYSFMFFSYPGRTVSFSTKIEATSHIFLAGFVFKYSLIALLAAIVLPLIVPKISQWFFTLEEKRKNREKEEK